MPRLAKCFLHTGLAAAVWLGAVQAGGAETKKPAPKPAPAKAAPKPAAKPAAKPPAKPAAKAAPAKAAPAKPAAKAAPKPKGKAPVRPVSRPVVKPAPKKGQPRGIDPNLLRKGITLAPSSEPETTSAPTQQPISTICIDADSGIILSESNADIPRPPASMIKLMLMLMVVEGLEQGKWKLDTPVTVSPRSQGMGGTQVLLKAGDTWPLNHLMTAVAVASANDAAMAVAEGLWGSEADYLKAANARAQQLGMSKTVIHGVHGLPPGKGEEFDQCTARDMSTLARVCVTKPQIMQWVGTRDFQLSPASAVHASTNKLLWRMADCDGMKTGFIRAAGFCITGTAKRGDTRLIAVVMGHPSKYGRFNDAESLLESGFASFRKVRLADKGDPIDTAVPAPSCNGGQIKLVTGEQLWVKMKIGDIAKLTYGAVLPEAVVPPVEAGAPLGKLVVRLNGQVIGEVPLVLPDNLALCGWTLQPKAGSPGVWRGPEQAKPKRGLFNWRN